MIKTERKIKIFKFKNDKSRLEFEHDSSSPKDVKITIYNEDNIGMFDCERVSTFFWMTLEEFNDLAHEISELQYE